MRNLDRGRLDQLFKTIERTMQFLSFVMVAQLWEERLKRNVELPQKVREAIDEKIAAEQRAQQMVYVLQKERQEADRKRVEAQGIADYQHIISESLTDKQLQYEQIKAYKEMALSQNAKIIITGKGNTPVILDTKN